MLKRDWGAKTTGINRTYSYLVKLQPYFLSLRWKTCPWSEHSDYDDEDWELYAALFRFRRVHCALANLFTSVQHCLQMWVHYLVTFSYKPVQDRLHSWMIFSNLWLTIHDFTAYPQVSVFTTTCGSHSESKPEPHHTTRHIILSLDDDYDDDVCVCVCLRACVCVRWVHLLWDHIFITKDQTEFQYWWNMLVQEIQLILAYIYNIQNL